MTAIPEAVARSEEDWPLVPTAAERETLAAVARWARRAGWRSGHRLGWVRRDGTVAVSWQPGVLEVWWRSPASRWPTQPVAHPVVRIDEVVHMLIQLRQVPKVFCAVADSVAVTGACGCDLAADGWDYARVVQDADLERRWREFAHRLGRLAMPR